MFTLLHGFYKYLVQKDEYCVLILGLDDAGKTVKSKHIFRANLYPSQLIDIYVSSADLLGSGKNKTVPKLQRNESEIHHDHCGTEHRSD